MSTRRIRRVLLALALAACAIVALRAYGSWRRSVLDPARPLVALPPTLDLPALGGAGARLDRPIEAFFDSLPWRARGTGCAWLEERAGLPYAERRGGRLVPIEHCLLPDFEKGELRIRDGAWRHGPDAPALRVQTFGGSVVGGYADAERGTTLSWPSLLADRLAADADLPPVEVASFALGGATSGPQLWMFEQVGRDEHPDAVILHMGENDLAKCAAFPEEAGERLGRVLGGAPPASLEELHPWFAGLRERIAAERLRQEDQRARSEAWLERALRDPVGVGEREPELAAAVSEMAALPWVRAALSDEAGAVPRSDPRWPELVERAAVLRRWSAVGRVQQEALADPRRGGAAVDPERVGSSFARDVPLDLVRRSSFLVNVDRQLRLAREGGAAALVVLPVIEHREHRGGRVDCPWTLFDQDDWMAYFDGPLREALRDVAEEHGATVVDLPALLAARPDATALFVDTVHMTRPGLELLVDALEPALRAALPGGGRPPKG